MILVAGFDILLVSLLLQVLWPNSRLCHAMPVRINDMTLLLRAKVAAILTTVVVLILAIVDMFANLDLTDVLLSLYFVVPVFLINLLAAPMVARLLGDKSL